MKKQTKLIFWVVIVLVVLIGFYGYTTMGPYSEEKVRVGVILPLSGNAAYYGRASQDGIEIAKEELINEFPDLPFEIYYEDSAYVPQKGVSAYTQLISAKQIDAVITAASHVSLAVGPLASEDNILQMAIFSSADKYSSPDDLSFRISTRNEIEAATVARFVEEEGYQKLGVIYLNNDFGAGFKDSLKEKLAKQDSPVEVVLEEAVLLETQDFRTIMTKMKQKSPDAIFMVGIAAQYAEILKQANELGVEVQFLSMRSAEDPVLIKNAGDSANGLIYTYPFDSTSRNQEVEEFVNAFQAKYGKIPDAYAAEGYEGLKLVAMAFAECGKDYGCIQNYLEGLEDQDSVFGPLSFDNKGDVYYEFFPKTVRDGKFEKFTG